MGRTALPIGGLALIGVGLVLLLAAESLIGAQSAAPGSREYRQQSIDRLFAEIDARLAAGEPDAVPDLAIRILDLERIDDPRHDEYSQAERRVYREIEGVLPLLDQAGEEGAREFHELVGESEKISHQGADIRRTAVSLDRSVRMLNWLASASRRELYARILVVDPTVGWLEVLKQHPVSRYLGPEGSARLRAASSRVRERIESACAARELPLGRLMLAEAEAAATEIGRCADAGLSWKTYLARGGRDPETPRGKLSDFTSFLDDVERHLERLASDLASVPPGTAAALLDQSTAALARLRREAGRIDDLAAVRLRALRLLGRGDRPEPAWARDRGQQIRDAEHGLEQLAWAKETILKARALQASIEPSVRALLERARGAEGLAPIESFFREAEALASRCRDWNAEARQQLERGRRCIEALESTRAAGVLSRDALGLGGGSGGRRTGQDSVPAAADAAAKPGNSVPPSTGPATPPRAVAAPAPKIDPDVFGGLKINGPTRIGVGWKVTYRATDHGGRPVSDVAWYSLSEVVSIGHDGMVTGLSPGAATIMASAQGMRAFHDFEVIADEGAAAQPGGLPSLTGLPPAVVPDSAEDSDAPASAGEPEVPAQPGSASETADEESPTSDGSDSVAVTGDTGFVELGEAEIKGDPSSSGRSPEKGFKLPLSGARASEGARSEQTAEQSAEQGGDGFEEIGDAQVEHRTDPPEADSAREQSPQERRGTAEAPVADRATDPVAGRGADGFGELGRARVAEDGPPADAASEGDSSSDGTKGMRLLGVDATSASPSFAASAEGTTPSPPFKARRSAGPGRRSGGSGDAAADADRRPFVPRRASVAGAGQPAAYHIFAACSRLGWAGALARYSVGPADASIADHLLLAGEHAMWANRTSYQPTPAWPGWKAKRGLWGDWAARLARSRDAVFRSQIAHYLDTAHEPLSQDLSVQTVGDPYRTPSCDAEYCRIGFLAAWGQQALSIADEARAGGNARLAKGAAIDGQKRLRLARDRLLGYERIAPASGRCADLSGVQGQLQSAIAGRSASAARAAWESALRSIMALGAGAPAADDSLLGGWVLADGRMVTVTRQGDSLVGADGSRELFRVRPEGNGRHSGAGLITARSAGGERSQWSKGLSIEVDGDSARGSLGQFGFVMRRGGERPLSRAAEQPFSDAESPCGGFEGYWQEVRPDWAKPPPEDLWPVVEVVCDGGKLIRRQCIPATGDSGLVFEERGAGTYVAVQETSDAAPGRRGYLEYIATINGDQWTQRAKSHLDTYPNPAAHRLPWAEKTYRRVAIQGRCGASTGRECMYQLCPMCPEPDDPLWVMAGGGRGCKQCLERIWAGNPPPIFECRRAKRIGRAVPIGTPGAVRVPSEAPPPSYPGQPAPSRAPAGASPSGQPENMFMMGVESQPTPSAGR